jgi:ABC-2 type transport system permease protein
MTVYRYFLKVALKNKSIILMYTGIFFLLTIITSGEGPADESSFVSSRLRVGIADKSGTEVSSGLADFISDKNDTADITDTSDENDIKESIFLEKIDAAIIIPEDFEEKVLQKEEAVLIYSDQRKPQTVQIQNQVSKYLVFANATHSEDGFDLEKVSEALEEEASVDIIGNLPENRGADSWFNQYFNFMAYVISAIYIGTIGYVMSDFREEKIENRRKISSIRLSKFNREVYLGHLTVAAFITFIFILGALVLRGEDIGKVNFFKYLINTIVFSVSILGFTYLVNNMTRNRFVKNGISNVFSLGVAFISGVFISQEFLGERVLAIARFFPTYYFIRLNNRRAESLWDMRYELSVQLLFAAGFMVLGLLLSKKNSKVA